LSAAGYGPDVEGREARLRIGARSIIDTIAGMKYDETDTWILMDVVATILQTKTLPERLWTEEARKERASHVWIPFLAGGFTAGAQVRIKEDLLSEQGLLIHGGRVGTVKAVRHGRVVLEYSDGKPLPGPHHVTAESLEGQVR
jgi:hypothetical protein